MLFLASRATLTEAATIRIDLPSASTVEVIAGILDALARIETGSAWPQIDKRIAVVRMTDWI